MSSVLGSLEIAEFRDEKEFRDDLIMTFALIFLFMVITVLILCAALFVVFEFYVMVIGHLKGAPYVPSTRENVNTMIELARLKPNERIVDFGSGGGALIFAAAKKGAYAIGIEINPFLVFFSRLRARGKNLSHLVVIEKKDFREFSLHDIDVVFLYLWPSTVDGLREKLARELKPGSRVVSNSFPLKDWRAAAAQDNVYLYIMGNI